MSKLISGSDLNLVSNLILGPDLISVSNLFLEKELSIQLYSRQQDEEVSGQVYHQHPMLHILNLMTSVLNWYTLSVFHVKSSGIKWNLC